MIQKGVTKVNELINEAADGIEFFGKKQFNKIKDRISYERNMCDSVFGLVFGDVRETKKNEIQRNIVEHQTKLFNRVKAVLEKYETEEILPFREFTMDSVDVILNSGDIPQAKVSCSYCEETSVTRHVKIFYRPLSVKSGCWVLSNFERHLMKYHCEESTIPMKINRKRKQKSVESHQAEQISVAGDSLVFDDEIQINSKVTTNEKPRKMIRLTKKLCTNKNVLQTVKLEITPTTNLRCDTSTNVDRQEQEDTLYTQMKQQIIKMSNAVAKNDDKTDETVLGSTSSKLKASNTIKYCPVAGDGNCLVSSLTHQLFGLKFESEAHKQRTLQLRKEVVEYIMASLPQFCIELKGRIYEYTGEKKVRDIEAKCQDFVEQKLSKSGFWCGAETTKAISLMHNVNIVIVNDGGSCQLAYPFNPKNTRVLLLYFHELNGQANNNTERNHFNSLVAVNDKNLDKIAKELVHNEIQRQNLKEIANTSHNITID